MNSNPTLVALHQAEDGRFEMLLSVTNYDDGFQKILDSAAAGYPYSGKSFKEVLAAEAAKAGYGVGFPECIRLSC